MFRDFHLDADFRSRVSKRASKWKSRNMDASGLAQQGLTDDTVAERCDHGTCCVLSSWRSGVQDVSWGADRVELKVFFDPWPPL